MLSKELFVLCLPEGYLGYTVNHQQLLLLMPVSFLETTFCSQLLGNHRVVMVAIIKEKGVRNDDNTLFSY